MNYRVTIIIINNAQIAIIVGVSLEFALANEPGYLYEYIVAMHQTKLMVGYDIKVGEA